jgi:predicted acyltransferase
MSQLNPSERLVSLDAFRGLTIALMVLVNDAGDGNHVYAPLQHADWHGWTLTDTVFPSFLWIVGVAITLSLAKRSAAGASRSRLLAQALKRAAILYALGLLVYAFPHFHLETQRLLGVLQRIGICYFIATAIYLTTTWRGQVACAVSLLAGYWAIMAFAPVPDIGAGYLDVDRNFAHYVDRIVLGVHNYAATKTWDPEGIISTLPAIATALLGVLAGQILRLKRTLAERTVWLFLAGNLLIAAGLICDQWLPINKKLWTSSFTLFMAGLDFVAFAVCLWLVDELGWKRITEPFVILGRNAIAIYMVSELFAETLNTLHWQEPLYRALFASWASPVNASLLWALAYTLLMFAVAWFLNRRGWFLRV